MGVSNGHDRPATRDTAYHRKSRLDRPQPGVAFREPGIRRETAEEEHIELQIHVVLPGPLLKIALRWEGHANMNNGSALWLRFNRHSPAHKTNTLPHADQT